LRFGAIATLLPAADLVRVGVAAEKYGFDSVWVPDHYVDIPPSGDRFDPWVILSAIASRTNRIMLSTAAEDDLRYEPSKLAHIMVTLDELSRGRTMVGLGSGEAMNVVPFGIRWEKKEERIQRLRETISVMRLLWNSSGSHPVSYSGRFCRLENAWLDTPPSQKPYPLIFVAALASNVTLELAGEMGDGWLTGYGTIDSFRERVKVVKNSAETAHRDPDSVRIAQWFCAALSDDENTLRKARRAIAPEVLFCADSKNLERYGLEMPKAPPKSDSTHSHLFADRETASRTAEAATKIPDEVIEEFVPCGSASHMIEVIDGYRKNGATDIVLRDVIGQIVANSAEAAIETLKDFSAKVMAYFREEYIT
jgi:alkanesulfonate monooxygenase SsuD/methylene tetrahydromethanopterin reductase-like flavin-dependent oxidoreductase (luciferase family)